MPRPKRRRAQVGELRQSGSLAYLQCLSDKSLLPLSQGNRLMSISVDDESLRPWLDRASGVVTALTPHIGYSAALAKGAPLTGRNGADLEVEANLMTREKVLRELEPAWLSVRLTPTKPASPPIIE